LPAAATKFGRFRILPHRSEKLVEARPVELGESVSKGVRGDAAWPYVPDRPKQLCPPPNEQLRVEPQ